MSIVLDEAQIQRNAEFVLDATGPLGDVFRIVIEFDLDPRDVTDALNDIELCRSRAELWAQSPFDAIEQDPPEYPAWNLTWVQDVYAPAKVDEYERDMFAIARHLVKGEYRTHRKAA